MMEWISVKDRLPEFNTPVLCYVRFPARMDSEIIVSNRSDWKHIARGNITRENLEELHGFHQTTFYWMPLPDPPK